MLRTTRSASSYRIASGMSSAATADGADSAGIRAETRSPVRRTCDGRAGRELRRTWPSRTSVWRRDRESPSIFPDRKTSSRVPAERASIVSRRVSGGVTALGLQTVPGLRIFWAQFFHIRAVAAGHSNFLPPSRWIPQKTRPSKVRSTNVSLRLVRRVQR